MMNNIEKALEGRGNLSERVRLADLEKETFNVEQMLLDTLKDAFEKEAPPGTSFLDWLKSKDDDYLKRIKLGSGGSSSKSKIKEPIEVKKIDLNAELLKTADMFSKLSSAELESISFMLKKMLKPKD
jgi:hypothetical protein|tara:strand:- start:681 stop:1061 length:381 start_codon:yes stop_codon:yes gene_type:complete